MYMQQILKYFPNITEQQKKQFENLDSLYRDWNSKINVISRKDIDNLYEHHVLHSLAIAKMVNFRKGTNILNFGKIRVAEEIATAIGLKNCTPVQLRGEEEKGKFDFVVSRAVMQLPDLMKIVGKNISRQHKNSVPNGIICLKGGDVQEEIRQYRHIVEVTEITNWFKEPWFKEKHIIYLPA